MDNNDLPLIGQYQTGEMKIAGGLHATPRIFGKDGWFRKIARKIRSSTGLKAKLLGLSAKVGQFLSKKLLGRVSPKLADMLSGVIGKATEGKIQ